MSKKKSGGDSAWREIRRRLQILEERIARLEGATSLPPPKSGEGKPDAAKIMDEWLNGREA